MTQWSVCQCTTGHTDKNGNRHECGTFFKSTARYKDCFLCWVKKNPTRVHYRMKTGRILTEADLDALSDEAERGYDISRMRHA